MNIIIPDSWIREFLKTDAKPAQIAKYLSLCAASVEKVEKLKDDWLYHVEITTNRVDMASVFGLAKDASAVLPRFNIKAELKNPPKSAVNLQFKPKVDYLDAQVTNPDLCPRFTAALLENATIKPSPPLIRQRLEKCGIRALNNVVDVSNYVMLELGQPMHTFDYDKIADHKMIMRTSKKGESIVTLDGTKRMIPEGSIVIEDGRGRIIDLCGIMGGQNSAIDENSKRVLLFVQTYDPVRIRTTCQKMAFRTDAASLFEKSLDPQNVLYALEQAVHLLEKITQGQAIKSVIDIYPKPLKSKTLNFDTLLVEKILGVKIPLKEIVEILKSLGFHCQPTARDHQLSVTVPSFRSNDVAIPEDLVEEVARLFGYHNLPSSLPTGEIPQNPSDADLSWEKEAKQALKYWGFSENYNYSMVSQKALENTGFNPQKTLKISNPLNDDLTHLRPSLLPSLLLAYVKNQYLEENLGLFELSKVYLPQKDSLPEEKTMLSGILTGEKFLETKGVIESLLGDLGVNNLQFLPIADDSQLAITLWHQTKSAIIVINYTRERSDRSIIKIEGRREIIGTFGQIRPQVLSELTIKGQVTGFDLDFSQIAKLATKIKKYYPLAKYPPIIEDLAVIAGQKILTGDIIKAIKSVSPLIVSVSLWDIYENSKTFRLIYQSLTKTLEDREVEKIRKKVIETLEKKFQAQIRKTQNTPWS